MGADLRIKSVDTLKAPSKTMFATLATIVASVTPTNVACVGITSAATRPVSAPVKPRAGM
jgi:hypothetical protein